jgi:L-amino acid N-acyltransferase YncA
MEPIMGFPTHPEVRPARPDDLDELQALLRRCSPETRRRRFHGGGDWIERRELGRIATPNERHRSWVAVEGSRLRGTATLAWGADGQVEAAFLVEDAWFRRGLGTALFAVLAAEARRSGLEEIVAWVQADNRAARQFLRSMAPGAASAFAGGGDLHISIPIPPVGPIATTAPSPPALPAPLAQPSLAPELASPALARQEIA